MCRQMILDPLSPALRDGRGGPELDYYSSLSLKYVELGHVQCCKKIQNAHAQPLFYSLKLLFGDTLIAADMLWFAKVP